MIALTIGIIISAIGGLLLSLYVKKEKHHADDMAWPIGKNCGALMNGRFSKFLGIPLENIGIIYYTSAVFFYLATLFRDISPELMWVSLLVTGSAFGFSLYLTIIQLFVIKKWCTICLGSGAITFLIMVMSFMAFDANFVEFAYSYRDLFKWVYILSVLVGTLVTTTHARTFVRFLRDFKISRKEERRLFMLSHTAWVALGFVVLCGIALLLTDTWREITGGSRFIVISIVTGVLVVYEVVLNMTVAPHLIDIHFGDKPELDDYEHDIKRKIAIGFMTTGVVSWYVLLALSTFNWFGTPSALLLLCYIALIIFGLFIALRTERILYIKSRIKAEENDN